MQRTASETMKPPAASRRVEPPTAGKAAARPAGAQGKDVGGVRSRQGRPSPAHEDQGRTWPDDCPGPSDGPGSGRALVGGARYQGPHHTSGALTSSATDRPDRHPLSLGRRPPGPWWQRVEDQPMGQGPYGRRHNRTGRDRHDQGRVYRPSIETHRGADPYNGGRQGTRGGPPRHGSDGRGRNRRPRCIFAPSYLRLVTCIP